MYIRIYVLNKMEDESDSDSSVDELKLERFKEATTYADSIVTECRKKENTSQKKQMPASLRSFSPVTETNLLNTTPEFRNFVAKKLSELLEQNLKHKNEDPQRKLENGEQDTGIKLFASSTTMIRDSGENEKTQIKQKPPVVKRRKLSSSSDSSDEEVRIAEAAISVEQIMKGSKTPHNGSEEKSQKTMESVKDSEEVINKVKKKKKHKKKKSEIKIS